jgi:CBS domain-containing protein
MRRAPIHTARPADSIEGALLTMRQYQVRRLPVLDADGRLKGVVSLTDIVLASQEKDGPQPVDIVSTLASICAHLPEKRSPEKAEIAVVSAA